jgi:hypothetical protein
VQQAILLVMNKIIIISVISLVFLGVCVSRMKYEVVFLRKTLKTINRDIEISSDNIKVLNAEWNYLNNPERLKRLARKYLPKMKAIGIDQIVKYNQIIRDGLVGEDYSDTSFDALLNRAIEGK